MPKIPVFESDISLTSKGPAIEVDTRSYGMEGMAAAQNWATIAKAGEKLSDIGFNINKALNHAQQEDEFNNIRLSSRTQLYQAMEEVKKNPDPNTWQTNLEEKAQQIYDNHLGMTNFPNVQREYKQHWATVYPTILHGVLVAANAQKIQNFNGNIEPNLLKSVELYNNATTELERKQIRDETYTMLDGGVRQMFLQPAKAEHLKIQFEKLIVTNQMEREVNNDPIGLQNRLKSDNWKEYYPELKGDEGKKAEFLKKSGTGINKVHQANELKLSQLDDNNQITRPMLDAMRDNNEISPSQHGSWSNWIQGKGKVIDLEIIKRHGMEIIDRINDEDKPLTVAQFQKSVKDGVWGMKDYNEYNNFIKQIQARDKGDEKSIVTHERSLLTELGKNIGYKSIEYTMFKSQWNKEKDLAQSKEDITKQFNEIADPYIRKRLRFQNQGGQPPPQPQTWWHWWQRNITGGGQTQPSVQAPMSPEQAKQMLRQKGYIIP